MKSKAMAKDLRVSDEAELTRTVRKLEEELFQHRLKKNTNQLENTMLVRNARRNIARVKTVLAEKLGQGQSASSGTPTGKEK